MKLSAGGKQVKDRGGQRWANGEVLPDLREKLFDPFQTLKESKEPREAVSGGGVAQIRLSQQENVPPPSG